MGMHNNHQPLILYKDVNAYVYYLKTLFHVIFTNKFPVSTINNIIIVVSFDAAECNAECRVSQCIKCLY